MLYPFIFSILLGSVFLSKFLNPVLFTGSNMSEENNKDYEFVTETIKKKPLNKKRLAVNTIKSIGMGIIAGLTACVIFAIFAPIIYEKINPEKFDLVSIPEDESSVNTSEVEPDEETNLTQEEKVNSGIVKDDGGVESEIPETNEIEEEISEPDKNNTEVKEQTETDENEESTETTGDDNTKTLIIQKEEITLSDYKKLYRDLSDVANVAKRSLTKVRGVTESTDWFNNPYETGDVSSGLIVADNGKELLIITNANDLDTSKEIEVTFCDGKTNKGKVKKADKSTGLVVVAVELEDIEESTKDAYATAKLGNSTIPTLNGTPIIALGAPLGIEDSMAVGTVTSNTRVIEYADSNIRYITTDIYGSVEGSGVLIDLDGNVLGIIFQGGTKQDTKNLIHAYSISDIKQKIEKLSNGQDVAYLGIIGTDVTKSAMEELEVPEGAYVKQVVVDSPAMNGGIQNGDVIVKLGTTDIRSFNDYRVAMSKCQPGDTAMVTVKRLGKDGYVEFSYEIYLEALK